jgi:hypothetical protein
MLGGKWLSAALSAAASLGLFRALAAGPLTLDELAARCDCEPRSLHRLMRVLAGEGFVSIEAGRGYALTELGERLRPGELGDLARFVGAPFSWDPWSDLAASIRSGESAFAKHHGKGLFEYLEEHEQEALLYHAAIDGFCRHEARALANAFDFSTTRRIADIGGGRGALLIEVLSAWKHLSGVLLERPIPADAARTALSEAGLEERCEVREGDFFVELPENADVLVLKHIIHSWDDETAIRLLRRCADAVEADGRILVIEGLLLPEGHQNMTGLLDLEMLVLCGNGHERSKPEMRRLLSAAGLRLLESSPLAGGSHLFVTARR